MDSDQRHQQDGDARRLFGRALWLKDNLPITPDEWALLNLLIFGDVPEKWPTSHEFERARARHTSSLRRLVALPIGDTARVESATQSGTPGGLGDGPHDALALTVKLKELAG